MDEAKCRSWPRSASSHGRNVFPTINGFIYEAIEVFIKFLTTKIIAVIFNSFEFLWLFPVIFSLYAIIAYGIKSNVKWPKLSNILLIAISYGLYIKWKPVYVFILLWVTAITYLSALVIEKKQAYGRRKYLVYCGLILTAFPLFAFKYFSFLNNSFDYLLNLIGLSSGLSGLNWVMPIGISFYTFQAIGYLADVYLRRIRAEHDWWDYMLFVCFFPQIASGPISKAKDLLPQIKSTRHFDYDKYVAGCKYLLWGMFLKVAVADKIGIIVDSVYNDYMNNTGGACIIACLLYSFQIYSDFAGYSYMAIGVGKLFGFDLVNNFQRPYLSLSVTEFWHRWHISLSTWLKDYIYIPLGGSRCSKLRNYWNIMVTFLISGLWHGANWTFVVWGGLHGLFQIFEKLLGLNRSKSKGVVKGIRIIFTFLLVSVAWIFFRMPTFNDAYYLITNMICNNPFDISLFRNNILNYTLYLLIISDFICEYKPQWNPLNSPLGIVRWCSYILLLLCILLMGVFDSSQFIYVIF